MCRFAITALNENDQYRQFHNGFLNEWSVRATGLVFRLESFQKVSLSSWEPSSNIVFVTEETTLKRMPLPSLER